MAINTSLTNYIDPRVVVSWAKANEMTDWLSTRSTVSYMPREKLIGLFKQKGCRIMHVEKKNMWVWSHLLVVARK